VAVDLDAIRQAVAVERQAIERVRTVVELVAALVAEVEDLRAKLTASRRQVRAAVACLTTPSARPDDDGPLRPWQIAFRLRRAGLRLDGKDHVGGTVIAEYQHPGSHYIGATIHVAYEEVGRR